MQKSLVMNLNFHNPVADQVLQAALEKAQKDPIVRSEILTISAGYLLRNAQKRQCAVDAVPLLKEAHNILPDRPTSLRLLGEAHLFLWKNVAAIVALGAALKIKPDAWAHYLSLVLLRSMADPERLADLEHPKQILPVAKQHVQPAIELNHAQPSNHNGPGTVLGEQDGDEDTTEKPRAIDLYSSFKGKHRGGTAGTGYPHRKRHTSHKLWITTAVQEKALILRTSPAAQAVESGPGLEKSALVAKRSLHRMSSLGRRIHRELP